MCLEKLIFEKELETDLQESSDVSNIDPIEAARILLNRSICAHQIKRFDVSLLDAGMARSILDGASERGGLQREVKNELKFRLRKAYFREAKAYEGMEDFDMACECYLNAINAVATVNSKHIVDEFLNIAETKVSMKFICAYYSRRISEAEEPNPVTFSRDGKGLTLIRPESARMSEKKVAALLVDYSVGEERRIRAEWLNFLSIKLPSLTLKGASTTTKAVSTSNNKKSPSSSSLKRKIVERGFLSGIRARAFNRANNIKQALKDAKAATTLCLRKFGEVEKEEEFFVDFGGYFHYERALYCNRALIEESITRTEIAQAGEGISEINENLIVDSQVAVVFFAKRAIEAEENLLNEEEKNEKSSSSSSALYGNNDRHRLHNCALFEQYFERMETRLADPIKAVFRKQSSKMIVQYLEKDKWDNAAEYVRPRPKYYYYYEWMKERIYKYYPQLCEPVVNKLLSLDGAELDLLLQHPEAIKGQTEEFLQVLTEKGEEILKTYSTPQLSWEEVQALRVLETNKKRLEQNNNLMDDEPDTDHAMIGASGDDGLTRKELLGKPVAPALPPDQRRNEAALLDMKSTMATDSKKLLLHSSSSSAKVREGEGEGVEGEEEGRKARSNAKKVVSLDCLE